jgi:hypothetical protein
MMTTLGFLSAAHAAKAAAKTTAVEKQSEAKPRLNKLGNLFVFIFLIVFVEPLHAGSHLRSITLRHMPLSLLEVAKVVSWNRTSATL